MKDQIKYMTIGFFLLMMSSVFSGMVESLFFSENIYAYRMQLNQSLEDNLWMLIIPLIVAPIFEELVFRGIILSKLNKRLSFEMSNTISSLLFALAHLDWSILPYFFNGLIYGWVKMKTDNLCSVMILHGLYNTIVFVTVMNT